MAHGGTLTINPETGLPEAGFLDSLLPTLLGGAATFFSGGAITPFMAALGVGGLTALTSKDLGKGLMAGLGAYGGSGIMEGLEGFGAADIGEKAIGAATADAANAGLTNQSIMTDTTGVMSNPYATAVQKGVGDRMAGATYSDKLKAGFSKALSNPGDAFNAIGGGSTFKGAAMLGAPLLSALSSQDQTSVPTFDQIKFDPRPANINIRREQLPYQRDTGSSGQRGYFGPTYIGNYAAEGGFVSDDGIEHFGAGGRTGRVSTGTPIIRTPADLVNLGNRGSKRFTPVNRDEFSYPSGLGKNSLPPGKSNVNPSGYTNPASSAQRSSTFVEKPVVQQPIQPAPQQPIQPITQQPMEPTRPVAQQPIEPPRPQQPMEPTQPTQRRIDETGMVPRQVVENPVIVPRLEGGRDSAARGGLMALAPGGYIDPDYDYSGYGRKKTDVVRPVTPMPDVPKPDFLAADGKTYRYDPVKKHWYVIKEAEEKTNPGVQTLMGDSGGPGGGENPPNTTPDYGTLATIGRTLSNTGLTTLGGYLSQQAQNGFTGQTIAGLSKDPETGLSPGELGGRNPNTGPTATGGKANSPSEIASLSANPDFDARQDEADAAVMVGNNAASEKAANAAHSVMAQAERNQVNAQAEQDAAMQSQANREAQSVENARGVSQKAMAADIAALVSELSDNPNDNPGRAPSLGTGTTAGWGGSDIGGSDLGGGEGSGGGVEGNGSQFAYGGMAGYAQGGLGSLGGYSDGGRLLRGPGDGVSDSIPATVGGRQPARLADGEFVVPARIVSELGNGSTEAGARALYKMMDRIQANRRKTTGKNSVAVNSKSHKYLPA